jgi:type VI secretion system lysozyme-like protein
MTDLDALFYPGAAPHEILRRELEMLLNTRCDREPTPELGELASSVLAYGLPDLSHVDLRDPARAAGLCALVRDRIAAFVPRLTDVSVRLARPGAVGAVRLRIEGRWRQPPRPDGVVLSAVADDEGRFRVQGDEP